MTEVYANDFFTITQYVVEVAHGTAIPAVKMWPGDSPKITTDTKLNFIEEKFNLRMKSRRALAYEQLYTNSLIAPNGGFQQLALLLLCGLKGVTPSEVTPAQGDYLYDFDLGLTVAAGPNEPKSLTLELGDNVAAYQVEYCMFDKITIKGDIPQDGGAAPVSVEGSYFGRRIVSHAFTASLALGATTPMNAKLSRLYMDSSWATLGNTELPSPMRSFQIEIMTGLHPDFGGSANLYFGVHRESTIDYTATFTIEGGTTAHALLAAQQAATMKFFRLDINGPAIGTGHAHQARFDMAGICETVGPNDSSDRGDNLSTIALHGVYDATGAKGLHPQITTSTQTP